jgi:hypothetical protein
MTKLELNVYDDAILNDIMEKLQKYSKYLDIKIVKKNIKKEEKNDIVTFFKNSGLKQSDLDFNRDEIYNTRLSF